MNGDGQRVFFHCIMYINICVLFKVVVHIFYLLHCMYICVCMSELNGSIFRCLILIK